MGVKGLYSVISKEPSRFGRRWCLGDCHVDDTFDKGLHVKDEDCGKRHDEDVLTKKNIAIYIDGPALHHHLITTASRALSRRGLDDVTKEMVIPTTAVEYLSSYTSPTAPTTMSSPFVTIPGIISPSLLYHLTTTFLSEFGSVATNDGTTMSIHLVFDGVSSIHKVKRQVHRLEESCHTADRIARQFVEGGGGNFVGDVLPHLWGEDAMAEAIQDLMARQDKIQLDGNIVSEKRMEEAVSNPALNYYIHWATGEAEGYIAHELIHRDQKVNRHIVLSNDTDFLLFANIPGFVPFHSLQFDDAGVGCGRTIRGFEYRRDRFLAAFFPSLRHHHHHHLHLSDPTEDCKSNDVDGGGGGGGDEYKTTTATDEIMTTIAALAGCDYTLPRRVQLHIDTARRAIVQSDLGGLKRKDRNRATSRGTLIAVLRFVVHFVSRAGAVSRGCDSDWKYRMVRAIAALQKNSVGRRVGKGNNYKNNGKDCAVAAMTSSTPATMLAMALDTIRNIYCGQKKEVVNESIENKEDFTRPCNVANHGWQCSSESNNLQLLPSLLPDLRRVLLHGILFCRPIIEMCSKNSCGRSRVLTAKKRKGHTCDGGSTSIGGSIWMEETFLKCRQHLYNRIREIMMNDNHTSSSFKNQSDEANLHLSSCHDRFDEEDIILEYCRSGTKHHVSYLGSKVQISALPLLPLMDSSRTQQKQLLPSSSSKILEYFVCSHTQKECEGGAPSLSMSEFVKDFVSTISAPNHFTSIASLLLTEKQDVIMLFLMTYIPPLLSSSSALMQPCDYPGRRGSHVTASNWCQSKYLHSMGRIQIALYHVKQIRNAVACTNCHCNRTGEKDSVLLPSFSAHEMFHDKFITCVMWESLMSCMDDTTCNREKLSLSSLGETCVVPELNECKFLALVMDDTAKRINNALEPNEIDRYNNGNDEKIYQQQLQNVEWRDGIQTAWKIWSRYHHGMARQGAHA